MCHARVPSAQTKVIQHLLQIEVNCNEVYLEHTLLAISVLNCARGRCNTSRGYSMHEPKANEPNTLKQPAKCVLSVLLQLGDLSANQVCGIQMKLLTGVL